ncbi:DUF418 domain-containing protein [Couchioplanes azureus]|uniref:DUF418 domain-containing protein n=1 Tax=Couchioplanes caeruleus TaxID=56438 RepID=UPI0016717EBE|nr:DUF418 domain-containing protein [Couchioplanes caeruleus]GGQ83658.1 hypothetical protein GCM10010166_62280 [Couchioplanes caeruleus subsp. azureus]
MLKASMDPEVSVTEGPVASRDRVLGLDLARGAMLLFIALANTHLFLRGATVLGGYPQDGSPVDRAVIWTLTTFVDGRAFPMFGLLFGYGVAQLARRHESAGPRWVTRLLWRRCTVLIGVGTVDALLFFEGDILAAYGVLLIVGVWMIRWKDRSLLLVAFGSFALYALLGGASMFMTGEGPDATKLPTNLADMITDRVGSVLITPLFGPLMFLCPFAVGLWAGRRRLLERPGDHRRSLQVAAVAGLVGAVLGAQPVSLVLAGIVTPPELGAFSWIGALHAATGVLGGVGYAALLTLLAVRLRRPVNRVAAAIAATGQRSMTCYLMQSLVWAMIFTPALLDLSDVLSVAGTAVVATATWAGTVLLADWMRWSGHRGPFERLVRRVTYGGRSTTQPGDAARST